MLDKIAPGHSDALMLGFETSDDSAVYRLTDDTRGAADGRLLHAHRRRPVRLRSHHRRQRALRHLRDGRPPAHRDEPARVPVFDGCRHRRRGRARRRREGHRGRRGHRRRSHHRRQGAQVRALGVRRGPSRQGRAQPRGARRRRAVPDQADRHGPHRHGAQERARGRGQRARRHRVDGGAQPARLRGDGRGRASTRPPTSPASGCSATCTRWSRRAAVPPSSTSRRCRCSTARSTTRAQGVMPGRTADVVAWADAFSAWERDGRPDAVDAACCATRRRAVAC